MNKLILITGCAMGLVALAVAGDKPEGDRPVRQERHPGIGLGAMDGDMMMPMMRMSKELGLSKEQMQQMREVFAGSTNEMKGMYTRMQEAAKAQAELMSQDSPNEEAVLKGTDEIAKLRAEIARIRVKQMLAAQKILTPEQRTKMREKMKAHMATRRGEMGERMKNRGQGFKKQHKDE
jgi:Spy/CpxP family protein refolding chaperone